MQYQRVSEVKTEVETISRQAGQASGSRVAASLVSTTMPMVLACAIGMLLGGLSMLSGVVLALYALLTQDLQSGAFWGWMWGALGCFFGGGGALLGCWNGYRQLEGAGDLMKQPGWTWLDSLIAAYTLLGLASITGGVVANYLDSPSVVTYSLLDLGGIVVFQGLLFLVFRSPYRRSARLDQASPDLKASDVKTDMETISRQAGQAEPGTAGGATSSVVAGNAVAAPARRARFLFWTVVIVNLVITGLFVAWMWDPLHSFNYEPGMLESITKTIRLGQLPVALWAGGMALIWAFYFLAWRWSGLPPYYPGRERDSQLDFTGRWLQTLPGATSLICLLGVIVSGLDWAYVRIDRDTTFRYSGPGAGPSTVASPVRIDRDTTFRYSAFDSDVGFAVAAVFMLVGLIALLSVCTVRVPRCSPGLITVAGLMTVALTGVYVLHNWGDALPGGKGNPARCWSSAHCWPTPGTTVAVSPGVAPFCALLLGLSLFLAPTVASTLPRTSRRDGPPNEAPPHGSLPPADRSPGIFAYLVQAWRQWWAERSRWFTWTIQGLLMLLHIVSMFAFISLHSASTWDKQGRRQVTSTIGFSDLGFSPWFVAKTWPDAHTAFRCHVELGSSWLFLLIGVIAYAILWWIEKAINPDAGKPGWWRTRRAWCVGSPTAVCILWFVQTMAAVAFAMWSIAAPYETNLNAAPSKAAGAPSVREVPSSEVEKRTPGLEVYRYDVKVPPGHEVEFFSQLFVKKPEPRKQHWGTAGVLRSDGIFELRLQKGETLNPDLKGKLRWDVRTEFGGVSATSGGWIDDPIAALGPLRQQPEQAREQTIAADGRAGGIHGAGCAGLETATGAGSPLAICVQSHGPGRCH